MGISKRSRLWSDTKKHDKLLTTFHLQPGKISSRKGLFSVNMPLSEKKDFCLGFSFFNGFTQTPSPTPLMAKIC